MGVEETRMERMARLSKNQTNIRNICTSAHIHHGKCVSPESRLILADGRLLAAEKIFEIAKLSGKKIRENSEETVFEVDDDSLCVFSLDKETGRLEKKRLKYAWKLVGGNAIKVTLRNGLSITTTPEHKFIVLEDLEFVEKEACELRLGDRVVCARRTCTESVLDLKSGLLKRLAEKPCYAKIKDEFGFKLKQKILSAGIESVVSKIKTTLKPKSFYHGVWQNRYKLQDLLNLGALFGIGSNELYDGISTICFRSKTKNTTQILLPSDFQDLFYLAGLFIGDGSSHRFVAGKEELAEKCVKICTALGIKPRLRMQKERTPEIATNKTLALLLNALFDYPLSKKSHNLHVSEFLSTAPAECIAQFLKGYFDCDGTVEKSRRAVSITSASRKMLEGLQLLLLRFDCCSILHGDTLYISGLSARNFVEKIGFGLEEKQAKARTLAEKVRGSQLVDAIPIASKKLVAVRKVPMAYIDHHYYKYEQGVLTPTFDTANRLKQCLLQQGISTSTLDKLTSGDLAFIEVKAIEKVFEPVVYDFTVPDLKNFIAEGIVVHNTALTDNLLAAAGLMAEKVAGSLEQGMATWQHKDEQERLLTVDAANVSMVHDFEGQEYLINLIDTPGHIDFGGNVTRAMRAVDGTVVLVCASEGIMPQTETVLKQALRERVKPVLFINKVDRLIVEMLYTPEQIQERFKKIILEFNRLIEQIAEPEFKKKWQVNFADGSVAFGSARDNWALSLPFMQKKGIAFKEILDLYARTKTAEERKDWAWKNAPLHEVLLDMVIKHLPNPLEAQKYRIPKIWRGELESEFGKDMLSCNPNGKVAFCSTRIIIEPKSGRELAVGRLYSGTLRPGMTVYLNHAKTSQRIAQVYMYLGIKPEIIGEVPAGNILALAGLTTHAGETITLEPEHPFEELKHIFEPVITKAIEPVKPQDLSKLVEVLKKVAKEDPSIKITINQETGENLMHGMGELHLEIVENRIKEEKKLDIKTSPPIVVYRETVTRRSPEAEGKSPNKHNKIYIVVEPLEPAVRELIKNGELPEGRIKKKDFAIRDTLVEVGYDNDTALSVKDIYKGNIFIDATRGIIQLPEAIELILDGFRQVMDEGPLAREPCFGVKVILVDAKLHEDAIHRGPAQMYPCTRDAIKLAMMQAGPAIFEPLQTHLIEAPVEYTGEITKLVMNKRGQVLELQQEGTMTAVKAKLPVAEMLGWSSDLRSATGGRGSSSLMDQTFERLPPELQAKVIRQIVQRKGLTEAMLGA